MIDIIIMILVNIISWSIVSTATAGFERYFLYAVIVASDIAYLVAKFKH